MLTAITAFRLELLNDPNLPLGGPGRSIKGPCALTEFSVECGARRRQRQDDTVKFARATADVNPPETPLEPIFDDRSGKKRITGPIAFAIDGKDETAWGIDIGPGRRNQPRKAVFVAEKPIGFAGGTILTFRLTQNHGGWNSDDNQNNNLGRFRLSVTTAPNAIGRSAAAARPRDPDDSAAQRTTAQTDRCVQLLADDRARMERRQRPDRALWRQHPEGASQLVLAERAKTTARRTC